MTAAFALTIPERRWTVPDRLGPTDPRHRYLFGWIWASGPVVVFCGLNPSTMTKEKTDHTGRKWEGFAKRWGFGGFLAVNAFALRSTDPAGLLREGNPVGDGNDDAIRAALAFPGVSRVVACWGDPPRAAMRARLREARTILAEGARERGGLLCFGLTGSGEPKHPLMLSYTTALGGLE